MAIKRANIPLKIYRGDTFWKVGDFSHGDDPEDEKAKRVDLTGIELTGIARVDPNDTPWFQIPITITDAKNGEIEIKLTPEQTTLLGAKNATHTGKYDIQAKDLKTGDVFTFATGSIVVTDDYTY